MPLYNAGKDVLQAFLAGHEEGRASKALKLKNEQETADREARQQQHEDALKQADTHFNASMALQKALKDLQVQEHRMNISKNLSEGMPSGVPTDMAPTTTPEQDLQSLGQGTFSHFDPLTLQKITGMVQGAQGPSMTGTSHFGGDVGDVQFTDPTSFAAQQADRQRTLLAPKQEGSQKLLDLKNQQATMLEQMKLDAQMGLESAKFKERQNTNAERYTQQQSLVRLRASLRPAKTSADKGDVYLSPDDAMKLNVPYGTTKTEAAAMQINPTKPRSPAEQAKLDGFIALRKELSDLREQGDSIGWSENTPVIGGMWGKASNKLGLGTEDQKRFRATIGKMTADQIHQTYGSVFSKNEQALSESWLPALNESGSTSKSKLETGEKYLTNQINGLLAPAQQTRRGTTPGTETGGIQLHYDDGSTETVPNTPQNRLKYGQHLGKK